MDEYYMKYARPLQNIGITETKANLMNWKSNLKDELEGLLYLRETINNDQTLNVENTIKTKISDIICKLENIITKEVEGISMFMQELDRNKTEVIDDKIYSKLEVFRDNYNKILLNIHKMISSTPNIMTHSEKYQKMKQGFSVKAENAKTREYKENRSDANTPKLAKLPASNQTFIDKSRSTAHPQLNSASRQSASSNNLLITENNKSFETNPNQALRKDQYMVDKELSIIESAFRSKSNTKNENINLFSSASTDKKSLGKIKTADKKVSSVTERSKRVDGKPNTNSKMSNSFNELSREVSIIRDYLEKIEQQLSNSKGPEISKSAIIKLREDHVKLMTDVKIMNQDIKELTDIIDSFRSKLDCLEDENTNLKQKNEFLIHLLRNKVPGINLEDEFKGTLKSDNSVARLDINKQPNNLGNVTKYSSDARQYVNSTLSENEGFYNTSSVELQSYMRTNNNASAANKKFRFLIPKKEN